MGLDEILKKSKMKNAHLPCYCNLGMIYSHFYALITSYTLGKFALKITLMQINKSKLTSKSLVAYVMWGPCT